MRTAAPKQLKSRRESGFKTAYDLIAVGLPKPGEEWPLQDVTIYPYTPLYLFSPGIRVYRAEDVKRFSGYLKTFEPSDIKISEEGEPEVTLTIQVLEEDKP